MYYDHFGLTQAPFRITPNTDFFFTGGNRGPILEALMYAITHGEGIVKVTGEVGSGKTMLCSMLQARLPENVESVYLANPSVAPEEVLHAIALDLHLDVARDAAHLTVMHALQDYLVKRHGEGKRVVVFIEESQSMPLATLEEVRLLSNLETRNDKLLQIVLFGQPELDENLRQQNIRQLRDRIAHSFRLEPLNANDVREYLTFRMRAAGYKGPDIFPAGVVKKIASASSGLTRRINLIADKALLAAFSENTHTIRPKHVKAALRDSEFSDKAAMRAPVPAYLWPIAAMVAGVVIGASVYAALGRSPATQTVAANTAALVAPAHEVPPSAATAAPAAPSAPTAPAAASASQSAARAAAAARAPSTPPAEAKSGYLAQEPNKTVQFAAKSEATGTRGKGPVVADAASSMSAVPVATSGPSLVEEPPQTDWASGRSAVTDRWLAEQPKTAYSIQLLGGDNEEHLRQHLNVLAKSVEMQKLFVYRVNARGKPWLNVLYGAYDDRRAAQRALDALPESLKTYRPMLRTVEGVRAEIVRQR